MPNNDDITFFAETNFRNARRRFGIQRDDRRRHMYIIGKTGVGKTTLMENMVISDILNGNGVGVVDPHGEFAEKILHFVPKERIKDVIYIDPSDTQYPVAFNPIEKVSFEQRHLVASGLMGVFKKIWPDVWSARMEYILNNTILALLEAPGSTMLGIMRMWSSKKYRKKALEYVKDPVIRSFWEDEFAQYNDRFQVEATASIQNKVGQFLSASIIRNIVGQEESSFDMRKAMDEQKIIIMNLSKGRVGEDNSKLLGGLLVAKLQLAAMSRVDMPEEERKDFFLYVDEFQNFATDSFANILSEARKYRLSLILANQYVAQLTEGGQGGRNTTVRDAIFGNVGTLVSFRVGADDAEFLEKEFEPEFTANDLVNLPKFHIYLKLMINGLVSRAFSAKTLPPHPMPERSFKDEIIEYNRQKYSRRISEVEQEIAEVSDIELPDAGSGTPKKKQKKGNKKKDKKQEDLFPAVCWECGDDIEVPFKPDGKRPVYCEEHLHLLNEESHIPKKVLEEAEPVQKEAPESISLKEAIGEAQDRSKKQEDRSKNKNNSAADAGETRKKGNTPDVNMDKLKDMIADTPHG